MSYKFNKLYDYPRSMRTLVGGKRHYDIREEKLPSVTTILSACQSDEKKASLEAWRQRLGPKTADVQRDLAAERGTAMHRFLEAHIDGSGHKDLTPLGVQAETMATQDYRIRAQGPGRSMGSRGDVILSWVVCRSYRCCRDL